MSLTVSDGPGPIYYNLTSSFLDPRCLRRSQDSNITRLD